MAKMARINLLTHFGHYGHNFRRIWITELLEQVAWNGLSGLAYPAAL